MNLVEGRIVDAAAAEAALNTLGQRVLKTLSGPALQTEAVLRACDRVLERLDVALYLRRMVQAGIDEQVGRRYLEAARTTFCADYLRARLARELGETRQRYTPLYSSTQVEERLLPVGVLLHVAAGNADGLPAFSVLEGLLTGNINLLKLPEVDGGISVFLLQELIEAEPALAAYVYVFDYSSRDTKSIARLVDMADGVVVWGGDTAVRALRGMVPPNTRLIEWGHKVSFAYVTKAGVREEGLLDLAEHICRTNQLLCSSCQGIFVDTKSMDEVQAFCEVFLPVLERQSAAMPAGLGIGTQAQVTLQLYTEELTAAEHGSVVFRGNGCSLMAYPDSALLPSIQFRNCWVRPLPRESLLPVLRPHKNHLHTVGLLCGEGEHAALGELLVRSGVVRVTGGANMSESYCGAAHDGEYSLRRYMRVVSFE